MILNHPNERGSWQDRATPGWYLGPAMDHFRSYHVLTDEGHRRISNSVTFFPFYCELPKISGLDAIGMAIDDFTEAIKGLTPVGPITQHGTKLNHAMRQFQETMKIELGPAPANPFLQDMETKQPPRVNKRQPIGYPIGTIIRKKFPEGYFEGEVIAHDPKEGYYKVRYTDSDQEELDNKQIRKYFKKNQKYSKKQPNALLVQSEILPHRHPETFIPTPKQAPKMEHALNAGSLWDEELKKFAKYRELINHPNESIKATWIYQTIKSTIGVFGLVCVFN